jgi:hypothetical protein
VFDQFEFGKVPVVAVLHGAVVGGGLELAAACHVRVAEKSAYYALPEGVRGIYVGGGGSVRAALIGASRMMDMMLTGRTWRRGWAVDGPVPLSGREWHRFLERHRARQALRSQHADDKLASCTLCRELRTSTVRAAI